MSRMAFTFRDFSGEQSSFDFASVPVTAANYAAQEAALATLTGTLTPLTLGTIAKQRLIAVDEVLSSARPTNPFAQRELKWLVQFTDDVNNKAGSFEIPTANPTDVLVPGTDLMDLGEPTPSALRIAIQANARTVDGNPLSIVRIVLVGRNL